MDPPADSLEAAAATWRAARRPNAARRRRAWAALVFVASGTLLGVAYWLEPDPRGYGTHQQFGSGPCGMLIVTGYPCPTCGMTTAFAHAVRGQWWRAVRAQPAGFALALAALLTAVGALYVLASGRAVRLDWPLITPYRIFVALLVLLVGGWAFKMLLGLYEGTLPLRGVAL